MKFVCLFVLISSVLMSCEKKYAGRANVRAHAVPCDLEVRLYMFTFEL